MHFKHYISLIFGAVLALFILQNIEIVNITFLFWSFTISRVLLIFLLLGAGAAIGWVLNSMYHKNR